MLKTELTTSNHQKYSTAPNKKHSHKLIDGKYNVEQANEILFSLVNSKINFHNHEIFSNQERFNADVSHSVNRIAELKEVHEEIKRQLVFAKENGLKLKVKSSVDIVFVKK